MTPRRAGSGRRGHSSSSRREQPAELSQLVVGELRQPVPLNAGQVDGRGRAQPGQPGVGQHGVEAAAVARETAPG